MRPAYQGQHVVDRPVVHGHGSDDLLRQHVQRVARDRQLFDHALPHPLGDDGGLDEVAAVLGEEHTAGDRPDLVTRPADPLQATGDRRRRLYLHDEVDRTHVDAQFQAAGRHDGGQPSRLQVVLDQRPLLLAHRAVVRPRQCGTGTMRGAGLGHDLRRWHVRRRCLLRDLVEPAGQPFREPPGVGEDKCRVVLLDQVRDALLHVRPDRTVGLDGTCVVLSGRCARVPAGRTVVVRTGTQPAFGSGSSPDATWFAVADLVELRHVRHRDDDAQVPLLLAGRSDDVDRMGATEETGDLLDGAHRRRQPDALRGGGEQRVQPFQAQREVGAALGARDGMHLIDDHRLHATQRLTRLRREQEEQRLRRGDQDVGRAAGEAPSFLGRSVPGADGGGDLRRGEAEVGAGPLDPFQRGAQVAVDVDRERLERRHIQHAAPEGGIVRSGRGRDLIDRPEERRQRLPGPGRRDDQGVTPSGDGAPCALLRRCGRAERAGEPRTGRRAEQLEDVFHVPILPRPTDKGPHLP